MLHPEVPSEILLIMAIKHKTLLVCANKHCAECITCRTIINPHNHLNELLVRDLFSPSTDKETMATIVS